MLTRLRHAVRGAVRARRRRRWRLMSAAQTERFLARTTPGWRHMERESWPTRRCSYWPRQSRRAGAAAVYACKFEFGDMMRLLEARRRVVLPLVVVGQYHRAPGVRPAAVRAVDIRVVTLAQFRRQPQFARFASYYGEDPRRGFAALPARTPLYAVRVDGERAASHVGWLDEEDDEQLTSDENFLGLTWADLYLFFGAA